MAIYIFEQTMKSAGDVVVDDIKYCRERITEKVSSPVQCIFTRIPGQKDIENYEEAEIGTKEIVSMYHCFTDNHALKCSVKLENKLDDLKSNLHYTHMTRQDMSVSLVKDGYEIAKIMLDEKNREYCSEISYYSYTKLLRKELYTNSIAYVDYYTTAQSDAGMYAKLTRRTFYNADGTVAYNQIFEGEKDRFLFPDGSILTKEQLAIEFIKKLKLSKQDVIILDDSVPKEFVQAVFAFGKAAHIVVQICAEQNRLHSDINYEWFPYIEMIGTIIVPTEEQKGVLQKDLEAYNCKFPDILVIPIKDEFASAVIYEANEGNLVLSWKYEGKADGFWIYDTFGKRICERRDMYLHYFLIKGCSKEKGIVIKTFVDTPKGSMAITESEPIYVSGNKTVNVMGIQETLEYIKDRRISIARFGDGETKAMNGVGIGYQEYNEELGKRLKQILTMPDNDKLLVCLPDIFERMERYNAVGNLFWKQHLKWYQDFYAEIVTNEKYYGNAFISRPYMDLIDKSASGEYFKIIKELFKDKEILIVEGFYSRSGVGNDLFQGAKSVERIICPSRNAYSKYDEILNAIRKYGKNKLILLMLGPTAKVLACDLAFDGYWAVDLGHIDSEYEWYKMGATDKVRFRHKHTAESDFDDNEHIELQNDDTYAKEIVAMLTDEH